MKEGIININLELVLSANIEGSVSGDMQKTVFARDWFRRQLSQKTASVDWTVRAQSLNGLRLSRNSFFF